MLRRLTISVALLFAALSLRAGDILTKTDGTRIDCKVVEVTQTEVKFRKTSNPDGPLYTMKTSDIIGIVYANGETESFNRQTPSAAQSSAGIQAAAQERAASQTSASMASAAATVVQQPVYVNKPAMSYRFLKEQYDYRQYVPSAYDRASPSWCGVASWFIPGLGQACCSEWGRAATFFLSELALESLVLENLYGSRYYDSYDGTYYYNGDESVAVTALIALIALRICDIVDATRVAKVKNMYYRDFAGVQHGIDVSLAPAFAFVPSGTVSAGGSLQPSAGLSLRVNF